MEFFKETIDGSTGEVTNVSIGDWITITELGKRYDAGPRQTRAVLIEMGFMFVAIGEHRNKTSIMPWVVKKGWGRPIHPRNGFEFDVINEDAQRWIAQRWEKAQSSLNELPQDVQSASECLTFFVQRRDIPDDMDTRCKVKWLMDHYSFLMNVDIAKVVGVSKQRVSKIVAEFEDEMMTKKRMRLAK